METGYDVVLTGSDGPVEGVAKTIAATGYAEAYEFKSVDDTIHLIIAKDNDQWIRVGGTDPYFTGWADELAEQILIQR
ncbi:hypothetical protein [Mucilaginibacter ginkgonis]|uniref:Uncharacterized protein n=1 Tax=Mucilaginibacter ginkgonis TaxID=2682091 RepID=A0A6I4HW10_9SPHI|nr:hypothetical protein [Mucilaginibacter ginkgonis]QQL51124.1 hypothetical protein GO620_006650 [Mucilaginibacter ginkgonis]